MGPVGTRANLLKCHASVSCTFKSGVFLTHPRGLRAKAFVPNPAGVKYPGDFLFLVHRGEMIFL